MQARALIAAGLVALFSYAAWPWLPGQRRPLRTVVVYGFSILGEVMNQSIFPAFQRQWLAQTGEPVELVSSFAGSGTITNQIRLGVPAQVAILATGLDALRLQEEGVATMRSLPQRGTLNRTPIVILVRPGNPKNIRDFADLARAGVTIVHPDPLTSGGAQWAILAEYSAALRSGLSQTQALHQLRCLWGNVVSQASSAQAARTQFEIGLGDALITYEQDLFEDGAWGRLAGEIVYPSSTVLSEHTVVTLPRHISATDRQLVEAFVAFLFSPQAQSLFAAGGFRSLHEKFNKRFPPIQRPFTVDDLGGWYRAKAEVVDGVWATKVLPGLGNSR